MKSRHRGTGRKARTLVQHNVYRPDYLIPLFNPYEPKWQLDDTLNIDEWRWSELAHCTGTDPEIWFASDAEMDRRLLTAICSKCPVQEACLDYALTHNEHGWWGGTSRSDRRRHARHVQRTVLADG